jgi:hypothetical protein
VASLILTEPISLDTYQRWDVAGVDGLATVKAWFGDAIDRLAPFQSFETTWQGQPCSVLRLCEGNFRLSSPKAFTCPAIPARQRVWVKQFNWLAALALPEAALGPLAGIVVPKPPFRLQGLEPNCAIPARLQGAGILIWRHQVSESPMLEIHCARAELARIRAGLHASRLPRQ